MNNIMKNGIKGAVAITSLCSFVGMICCLFKIRKIEDDIDLLYGLDTEEF